MTKDIHIVFDVLNFLHSDAVKEYDILPIDKLILINLASHNGPKGICPSIDRIAQELPPISIAEYLHEQSARIQGKGYFTNKDLLQFFRIFGEIRPGGFNLADRKNFDNKKVLKDILVEPSYPGADHPMIKVFRSDKETGIYVLDTTSKSLANKNKVTYVSLRKTSNKNKHLVGGEFLNIKKVPGNYDMEELLNVFQAVLDNTKYTDSPDSVYQLCML
jgi:hypothetical protein